MPRLKGKYKGKTGKIDIIEDILGTEALKGTYEARKRVAKINALEEKQKQAETQKRIEVIKKQREKLLRGKFLDDRKVAEINRKIDFILPFVLEFNAYYYLQRINKEEPEISKTIIKYLFPPSDMGLLDGYVEAIQKRGRGPKNKVTYDTIDRIYRKIKGMGERLGRKVA